MASIHKTNAGYEVRWRYGKKQFNQTAKGSEKEALAIKGRIDDVIHALDSGRITLPEGADYATVKRFIFTGGRKAAKDQIAEPKLVITIDHLFKKYFESLPSNAANTLATKAIHRDHLCRILGGDREVESLDFGAIQDYVNMRGRGYRGKRTYKPVEPDTISKELTTLGEVWRWGRRLALISKDVPWEVKNLNLGKARPRERFRDYDEILEIINDGKLSQEEQAEYWECLYLRSQEVSEFLDYVCANASAAFMGPMFAMCALTGCRRGEALRALKRDFDFKKKIVTIREKKKDNSQEFTMREVPMLPRLAEVMKAWFGNHPGGPIAICNEAGEEITVASGRIVREFKKTLRGSKWAVMPGFHCLRHSFASNLASKGTDQNYINKWMGHLDEKTAARYRHLYRQNEQAVVPQDVGKVFRRLLRSRAEVSTSCRSSAQISRVRSST